MNAKDLNVCLLFCMLLFSTIVSVLAYFFIPFCLFLLSDFHRYYDSIFVNQFKILFSIYNVFYFTCLMYDLTFQLLLHRIDSKIPAFVPPSSFLC